MAKLLLSIINFTEFIIFRLCVFSLIHVTIHITISALFWTIACLKFHEREIGIYLPSKSLRYFSLSCDNFLSCFIVFDFLALLFTSLLCFTGYYVHQGLAIIELQNDPLLETTLLEQQGFHTKSWSSFCILFAVFLGITAKTKLSISSSDMCTVTVWGEKVETCYFHNKGDVSSILFGYHPLSIQNAQMTYWTITECKQIACKSSDSDAFVLVCHHLSKTYW